MVESLQMYVFSVTHLVRYIYVGQQQRCTNLGRHFAMPDYSLYGGA
jgi:hypothetical protein